MDFLLWSDSLLYPKDTFRAEAENPSFKKAIKNVLAAGLIYGAITGFLYDIFPNLHGLFFPEIMRELFKEYLIFSNLFFSGLLFLFFLFFISLILFFSSLIFKGYGNFKTQTYLLSSLAAPLILSSLLILIPVIGKIMAFLVFLYSFYPLTLALRETHRYGKKESILTLVLSLMLFLVCLVILVIIFLHFNFSLLSLGKIDNSVEGFKNIKIIDSDIHYYRQGIFEFKLLNTLTTEMIVTDLRALGDCSQGEVDLDTSTPEKEVFILIPPEKTKSIKIINCTKKFKLKNLIGSRFSVPLLFDYQEKRIGKGIMELERGVLEGMVE